jgi:branched-chain amino acid transport system ATP-binding protein
VADSGYDMERGVLVAHGSSKLLARSSVIQEAYLGAAASDTRTASQALEKTVRST